MKSAYTPTIRRSSAGPTTDGTPQVTRWHERPAASPAGAMREADTESNMSGRTFLLPWMEVGFCPRAGPPEARGQPQPQKRGLFLWTSAPRSLTSTMLRRSRTYVRSVSTISRTTRPR